MVNFEIIQTKLQELLHNLNCTKIHAVLKTILIGNIRITTEQTRVHNVQNIE